MTMAACIRVRSKNNVNHRLNLNWIENKIELRTRTHTHILKWWQRWWMMVIDRVTQSREHCTWLALLITNEQFQLSKVHFVLLEGLGELEYKRDNKTTYNEKEMPKNFMMKFSYTQDCAVQVLILSAWNFDIYNFRVQDRYENLDKIFLLPL